MPRETPACLFFQTWPSNSRVTCASSILISFTKYCVRYKIYFGLLWLLLHVLSESAGVPVRPDASWALAHLGCTFPGTVRSQLTIFGFQS